MFIDGDHSYEAAKADIEAWRPKVRTGGLLNGHDYDSTRFPGMYRAVDQFAEARQFRIVKAGRSVGATKINSAAEA